MEARGVALDILNSRAAFKAPALFGGATGAVAAVFHARLAPWFGRRRSIIRAVDRLPAPWKSFEAWQWLGCSQSSVATTAQHVRQTASDAAVQGQWFTEVSRAVTVAVQVRRAAAEELRHLHERYRLIRSSGDRRSSLDDTNQSGCNKNRSEVRVDGSVTFQAIPSFAHAWNSQSSATGLTICRWNSKSLQRGKHSQRHAFVTASLEPACRSAVLTGSAPRLAGLEREPGLSSRRLLLQSLFDTPVIIPCVYVCMPRQSNRSEMFRCKTRAFTTRPAASWVTLGPVLRHSTDWAAAICLDQRWVLAIDVLRNNAKGFLLTGLDAAAIRNFCRSLNSFESRGHPPWNNWVRSSGVSRRRILRAGRPTRLLLCAAGGAQHSFDGQSGSRSPRYRPYDRGKRPNVCAPRTESSIESENVTRNAGM